MTRTPSAVSAIAMFLPGPGLAGCGWSWYGEPYHLAGLAAAVVIGVACWPLAVLTVAFGIPAALMAAVPPRPVRRRWRARNPGRLVLVLHWVAGVPVGRDGAKSAYIPKWLERVVYAADRHCCVGCGSDVALNVDHIMPWSLGGLTCLWNLMTLCGSCNRAKSNAWVYGGSGGFFPGRSHDPGLAVRTLHMEKLHRYNPARWYRAAWELTA